MDRAARTRRPDPVAGGIAVAGEHENVVAERLEVVGHQVPRDVPLVVERRGLLVGLLGEVAAEAAGVPRAVAGDAAHHVVAVGAALGPRAAAPLHRAVLRHPHRLGEGGEGVVVVAPRIDGGLRLRDLPGEVGFDHRVLVDPLPFDHEPALAGRRAQFAQVAAALRARGVRGRAAGAQRGDLVDGAVAVDAGDLDRRPHLAVEFRIAMHVLDEVAVDAVHAALHVDVEQMHGQSVALVGDRRLLGPDLFGRLAVGPAVDLANPLRHLHGRPQCPVARVGDWLAAVVEQVALAVVLEDGAVGPAVAVKVGELRLLGAVVEIGEVGEKLGIGEPVLRGRLVRIGELAVDHLLGGRIPLLPRVDEVAVGLLVPPHVADVAVHHRRAGMDVADDALAGGDAVAGGEFMADRMAALPLGDRRILRKAAAPVAEGRVGAGMHR